VSLDGDYAVVGARWQDGFKGTACVLKRTGDRWTVVQTLSPSDLGRHDQFGSSVSIDGDCVVVGAPWQSLFAGAAYVYRRVGDRWEQQQRLTANDAPPEARFGYAVEVEGNALTVSGVAPRAADTIAGQPAYRFEWRTGEWAAQGRVWPSEVGQVTGNAPAAA
jgi:hypothetical protein